MMLEYKEKTMQPAYLRKLDPFNPERQFIVIKAFKCEYLEFAIGSEFDRSLVTTRTLRQLYEQRFIAYHEDAVEINITENKIRLPRFRVTKNG